jgi:hypothetical protein
LKELSQKAYDDKEGDAKRLNIVHFMDMKFPAGLSRSDKGILQMVRHQFIAKFFLTLAAKQNEEGIHDVFWVVDVNAYLCRNLSKRILP